MKAQPLPRDERRRRTETGILNAARELFAEQGFERTTIRGVAAVAGVDPALVMQYYGSKEGLFAAAARWSDTDQRVLRASLADLPDAALADLFSHFEDSAHRDSMIALMRNCLTHPSAAAVMRDDVMCERRDALAAKIEGPDTQLRAGLVAACMMGLAMARYLLEVPPVAGASREDVERLFRPALQALVDPEG